MGEIEPVKSKPLVKVEGGITPTSFKDGVGTSSKLNAVEFLNVLKGAKGGSVIKNPLLYSQLMVNADALEIYHYGKKNSLGKEDGFDVASLDRSIAKFTEDYCGGEGGKFREKLTDATKTQLQNENEIKKAQAGKIR